MLKKSAAFALALALCVIFISGNSYAADSVSVSAPAYSAIVRDWYSPIWWTNKVGSSVEPGHIEGNNYYSKSIYLFIHTISFPNGTEIVLSKNQWDSGTITGSVQLDNPYSFDGKQTHYFSNASIPEQEFLISISDLGHYKLELNQIEIPAILAYKNPKESYNIGDIFDNWTADYIRVRYEASSIGVDTETWCYPTLAIEPVANSYCRDGCSVAYCPRENQQWFAQNSMTVLCAKETSPGVFSTKETNYFSHTHGYAPYNNRFSGSNNCNDLGMDYVYNVAAPDKSYTKFNHAHLWSLHNDATRNYYGWLEQNTGQKIKVSELPQKVVWSTEFDVNQSEVPVDAADNVVENENQTSISPFALSAGNSESKSSDGGSSNTGNALPVLAVVGLGAAAVAATSRRGKIVLTNIKTGFTDFARAQMQKTKDTLAFIEEEKNGYWVKKWEAEQEARERAAREKALREQQAEFEKSLPRIIAQNKKNEKLNSLQTDVNDAINEFNSGKISADWFKQRMEFLSGYASKEVGNKSLAEKLKNISNGISIQKISEDNNSIAANDVIKTNYQPANQTVQAEQKPQGFFNSIFSAAKSGADWIGRNIMQPVADAGKKIYHAATELPIIGGAVKFAGENIFKPAINFVSGIAGAVGGAVDSVGSWLADKLDGASGRLADKVGGGVNSVSNFVGPAVAAVVGKNNSAGQKVSFDFEADGGVVSENFADDSTQRKFLPSQENKYFPVVKSRTAAFKESGRAFADDEKNRKWLEEFNMDKTARDERNIKLEENARREKLADENSQRAYDEWVQYQASAITRNFSSGKISEKEFRQKISELSSVRYGNTPSEDTIKNIEAVSTGLGVGSLFVSAAGLGAAISGLTSLSLPLAGVAGFSALASIAGFRIANSIREDTDEWQRLKATVAGTWDGIAGAVAGAGEASRKFIDDSINGIQSWIVQNTDKLKSSSDAMGWVSLGMIAAGGLATLTGVGAPLGVPLMAAGFGVGAAAGATDLAVGGARQKAGIADTDDYLRMGLAPLAFIGGGVGKGVGQVGKKVLKEELETAAKTTVSKNELRKLLRKEMKEFSDLKRGTKIIIPDPVKPKNFEEVLNKIFGDKLYGETKIKKGTEYFFTNPAEKIILYKDEIEGLVIKNLQYGKEAADWIARHEVMHKAMFESEIFWKKYFDGVSVGVRNWLMNKKEISGVAIDELLADITTAMKYPNSVDFAHMRWSSKKGFGENPYDFVNRITKELREEAIQTGNKDFEVAATKFERVVEPFKKKAVSLPVLVPLFPPFPITNFSTRPVWIREEESFEEK